MKTTPSFLLPSFIALFLSCAAATNAAGQAASGTSNLPDTVVGVTDVDVSIFERVEVEASFPGGLKGWTSYLQQNLRANVPVKRKAPVGNYTVVVQFIVDKAGAISNIKALTQHGYGMEEEVIRVIKKSPRWSPAMQNGRVVKAYRNQPITFAVSK